MIAFQNPCRGSTKALAKKSGLETWPSLMRVYTRLPDEGIHVMRRALKKSMAHLT